MRTVSFKIKIFKNDSYIVFTDDKQKDKRFTQTTDNKTNNQVLLDAYKTKKTERKEAVFNKPNGHCAVNKGVYFFEK